MYIVVGHRITVLCPSPTEATRSTAVAVPAPPCARLVYPVLTQTPPIGSASSTRSSHPRPLPQIAQLPPLTIGPSPTPKARTHLPRRQPRRRRRSGPHPHPQLRIVFLIRGHPSTTCDCSIPFVPQTCLRNWHHEASLGERRRPRMCPGQQHTSTRNAPELTIETLSSLPTVPSSVSLPVSVKS
jgi:hypothetical protein